MSAMKLYSTPLPVLADASKMLNPVLLVNSRISSSVTYLSGIYSISSAWGKDGDESRELGVYLDNSTKSYLFAITIIWIFG